MLYSIILAIILIICILLTIVVLLQPGQNQGMGAGFAGGSLSGGAGIGARRTADLLSKSTTVLATALLVLCVLANFAINREGPAESVVQKNAPVQQPLNVPSQTKSAVPTVPTTPPDSNS